MNKTQILLTLVLFTHFCFAQDNVESRGSLSDLNSFTTSTGAWIPAKPNKNIILGSTYLFSNWVGQYKVASTSGQIATLFNLNYNIKEQTLEASMSNDSVFQYDIEKIDYILHGKNKYKVLDNGEIKGLFMEIISSEKIKVYKGYSIEIIEGSLNPLTQEKISEDTYQQSIQYYYVQNEKYQKFKPSKKSILKLLNDKSVEMKDYFSKHNFDFDNDQDLKTLFNYYNTL